MPKVLVSKNSELLRHFTAPPFKRLDLQLLVAGGADEARTMFQEQEPALAVLDVELGGFEVAKAIKAMSPATRVILVAGKRLTGDQMREVSACGCDELLIAPMTADELHDVVAIQLGEPRPGTEAFAITVEVGGPGSWKTVEATISNLSVDGVRLVVSEPVTEGQAMQIAIAAEGEPPFSITGTAVWAQPRDGKTVVGVGFDKLEERARSVLAKLTQWQVVKDGERIRVVLRGDFTEATRFDELIPAMVGRVVFDTAQVTYMNSLGVRAWCEFLRQARIQGYEFHACSVPFILQASMVRDVLGRGTVTSFFAPYHCLGCDHQEERLLQTAALLAGPPGAQPVRIRLKSEPGVPTNGDPPKPPAPRESEKPPSGAAARTRMTLEPEGPPSGAAARTRMTLEPGGLEPPIFKCPSCGGALEFDDLPERYFAFLEEEAD